MKHSYQPPLLILPLHQWVVNESVQDAHETVFISPQDLQCDLTSDAEKTCYRLSPIENQGGVRRTLRPCHTEGIDNIISESERHTFRRFQGLPLHRLYQEPPCQETKRTYLLEKTIEVNVYDVPGVRVHENVFEMTVAQAVTWFNGLNFRKGSEYRTQE